MKKTILLLACAIAMTNTAYATGEDVNLHNCLQHGVQKEGYNALGASSNTDNIVQLLMHDCPDETMAWQTSCESSGRSRQSCEIEEMGSASKAIKTFGK